MPRLARIRGNNIDIGLTDSDISIIRDSPGPYSGGLRTPHVTGRLRGGFVVDDGMIVNSVPYAHWVERGNSRFSGRFMVSISITEIAMRLVERIKGQLERADLLDLPRRR